jgi:hypothetical protein
MVAKGKSKRASKANSIKTKSKSGSRNSKATSRRNRAAKPTLRDRIGQPEGTINVLNNKIARIIPISESLDGIKLAIINIK